MKSKICFFHSGHTQRRLKDALAVLRSDGFTSRDQHDFIINYLCKCNKDESFSMLKSNSASDSGKYLEYLINLKSDENDKTKILFKIKQLLIEIYEEVKLIESKQKDFLDLIKFLQLCACHNDLNDVVCNFFSNISFNSSDSTYTFKFPFPLSWLDYHKYFWPLYFVLRIQSNFKCRIRVMNGPESTVASITSYKIINFDKVKDALLEHVKNSGLANPSVLVRVDSHLNINDLLRMYLSKKIHNDKNCVTRVVDRGTIRVWGSSPSEVESFANGFQNFVEYLEERKEASDYDFDADYHCSIIDDLIDQNMINYSKRYIQKLNNKKKFVNNLLKLKLYYRV